MVKGPPLRYDREVPLYHFFVQPKDSELIGDPAHERLVFEARNNMAAFRQAKKRLKALGSGWVAQVLDDAGTLIWMDVGSDPS